ncbi:MAG: hypothetical protein IT426_02715 [Pirellulales bacterium]|nr:hypothetical protein [Pirellulales bacterium]
MHFRLKRDLIRTPLRQIGVLTAAMLSIFAAAIPFGWWLRGPEMLGIAGVLAGLCYAAAVMALLGESYFSARRLTLWGMCWSMSIRTGVPLLAVMMMKVGGGPFAETPAICYLLVFYFGALAIQVALSYCAADDRRPAAPRNPSE